MVSDQIREAMRATKPSANGKMTDEVRVNEHVTILSERDEDDYDFLPPKKFMVTRAAVSYDKVALVAAAIGIVGGLGVAAAFFNAPIGIYMLAMATFHLLEFWVTARFNKRAIGMWSFLLMNGAEYAAANLLAAAELLVKWYVSGEPPKYSPPALLLVFAALAFGQAMRSCAMIAAAQSFNHYIQRRKKEDHVLVKTGIYGVVRHPSYFGYYLWMISTQVLVRNWIMTAVSVVVLHKYFTTRLMDEEAHLIRFFGDEYLAYKRDVWSGIPFYS